MRPSPATLARVLAACAAAVTLLPAPAAASDNDPTYFILVGTGPGVAAQTGYTVDRSTGRATPIPNQPPARPQFDSISRTLDGPAAHEELFRSDDKQRRLRALAVSPDGRSLLCNQVGPAAPKGPVTDRLLLLDPAGKLLRTITLPAPNLRVFGAPAFLGDGKRLALTLCTVAPDTAAAAAPNPAPVSTKAPPLPRTSREIAQRRRAVQSWDPGMFPAQPYVATVDLDGKDLKRLAPGALPACSPDGKTILFTRLTFDGPDRPPTAARLSAMDPDGRNVRPVGPDMSCDGAFSPDGKRIVYVVPNDGDGGPTNAALFVADADGSAPRPLNVQPGAYSSPRFLDPAHVLAADGERLWVLDTDGKDRRPLLALSKNLPDYQHCTTDVDAAALIGVLAHARSSASPDARHPTSAPTPAIEFKLIPRGSTVVYRGTEVYLRDPSGKLTPMPDGNYHLPNGLTLRVRAGQQVTLSN